VPLVKGLEKTYAWIESQVRASTGAAPAPLRDDRDDDTVVPLSSAS
jgi:hypothetical protein